MSKAVNDLDAILSSILYNKVSDDISLVKLIFANYDNITTFINNTHFSTNINKLASCFDLNNDGTFSEADLEYLKELDMVTVLKIVNAASLVTQVLKELGAVKLDISNEQFLDLSYRVILYSIFLPLIKNNNNFKVWLEKGRNKELLMESLRTLYNLILTSEDAKNAVSKIMNAFKSKCSCFSAKTVVSQEKVNEISKQVNTELKHVNMANDVYTTKKHLAELQKQMETLKKNLDNSSQ